MWKFLLAILLPAGPLLAQENPSAYEALRVIGTQMNRQLVNRVISINGTEGDPQPRTWKILVEDRNATGGVREIVCRTIALLRSASRTVPLSGPPRARPSTPRSSTWIPPALIPSRAIRLRHRTSP